MTVFITGATGFVGRALIARLVQHPEYILTAHLQSGEVPPELKKLGIQWTAGDLLDVSYVKSALKNQNIIIHLGGVLNPWGKPWSFFETNNVLPTKNLVELAPKTLVQFVYVSSAHVHGVHHKNNPRHEESPFMPSTQYARSKVEGEKIVRASSLPYTIIRPTMIYGPGDKNGMISKLMRMMESGTLVMPSGGTNHVHLLYISDLIEGIAKMLNNSAAYNEIFILSGPHSISMNNLLDLMNRALKKQGAPKRLPHGVGKAAALMGTFAGVALKQLGLARENFEPLLHKDKFDIFCGNRSYSSSKAQKTLGWHPRVSEEQGLKRVMPKTPNRDGQPWDFDGVNIQKLAEQIQTPFYVFSQSLLQENYRKLYDSLTKHLHDVAVYYSAKTNYEPAVLASLRALGSGVEIACGHELFVALREGFPADRICYDGAVKTRSDIAYALKNTIRIFNADSLQDAMIINQEARKLKVKARVGLRINMGLSGIVQGPAEIYITKFGVPLQDVHEACREIANLPHVTFEGLATHMGSQIISVAPYVDATRKLLELAKKLESEGITIKEINIGGGFPSATLKKTTLARLLGHFARVDVKVKTPPLHVFGEAIGNTFKTYSTTLKHKPRLAVEPGRSLASSMGILVSRVAVNKGKWVFLDVSKYALPESIFFAENEIFALTTGPKKRYNLAGASLNTADIFRMNIKLPALRRGDIVILKDAGAYSVARAIPFTVRVPAVYLITSDGRVALIRRPTDHEDVIAQAVSS